MYTVYILGRHGDTLSGRNNAGESDGTGVRDRESVNLSVNLSVDRCGFHPYNYRSPIVARVVSVAQLAEHQTVALAVAGSTPVTHPIIFRRL